MKPERLGFRSLEFVAVGGGDEDVFFLEDIASGGMLEYPELVVRMVLTKPLGARAVIRHVFEDRCLGEYAVDGGSVEWAGRLLMARGRNTLVFEGFGDAGEILEVDIVHRSLGREFGDSLVRALVLLVFLQTFIVQTYRIPSPSMEKTFMPGDYVLVSKLEYLFRQPHRGDIVVFRFPLDFRRDFVKRVVAVAGDEVIIQDGKLFIDGEPVDESGYARCTEWLPFSATPDERYRNFGPFRVPPGCVFVMGDNRDNSYDSRAWGPLPIRQINGCPWMIYWPTGRVRFMVRIAGRQPVGACLSSAGAVAGETSLVAAAAGGGGIRSVAERRSTR